MVDQNNENVNNSPFKKVKELNPVYAVPSSMTEEEIYANYGTEPPNKDIDPNDVYFLTLDEEGDFSLYSGNDEEHNGDNEEDEGKEIEVESEVEAFLRNNQLPEFARLKLEAKASKNTKRHAELVELEKLYKAEVALKEKELKAIQKENEKKQKAIQLANQRHAENFFKEEEKKEKAAKKEAERLAQQNHKAYLAGLADDEPTPELVYAQTVGVMPNLAVDVRDENVSLYEWAESYWKLLTKHEGKKRAFEWLEKTYPNMAGNKLAGNAYESSLFKVQSLPPKPKETIIPMLNAWIFVTDDNNLLISKPDKAWGVTYNIKAKLDFKEGSRFYVPKPLPKESRFYKFLATSLSDIKERELVQEYCGYTLTNHVKHQVAQVWEGEGSNGKSVLLAIMQALHKNAVAINLDHLEGPEMASIKDASIAISAETPKGKLNENELKKLIAGDLCSFRNLYERKFDHRPTAKWIMACNRFPRIQDSSNGVFRRLQYIRWAAVFEGKDIIKDLENIIIENELNLVVDWCLEGLIRLNKRDAFDPPETVKARLEEEKLASNSVLAFVKEFGYRIDKTGLTVKKDDFYKAYETWCLAGNITLFGGNEFWKRMGTIFPDLLVSQPTINGVRKRVINLTTKTAAELKAEDDEAAQAFEK